MDGPRVPQKWRPTLAMIVFAVLLTVLVLPAAIVLWFRYLEHTPEMRPIEVGALAVALVITVVIAVVFLRTITGPINALVKRTEEIGRGGRAAIVAPEQLGTREIATLSQSFLDLAERLQLPGPHGPQHEQLATSAVAALLHRRGDDARARTEGE